MYVIYCCILAFWPASYFLLNQVYCSTVICYIYELSISSKDLQRVLSLCVYVKATYVQILDLRHNN